jgi:hypothetical protein
VQDGTEAFRATVSMEDEPETGIAYAVDKIILRLDVSFQFATSSYTFIYV